MSEEGGAQRKNMCWWSRKMTSAEGDILTREAEQVLSVAKRSATLNPSFSGPTFNVCSLF